MGAIIEKKTWIEVEELLKSNRCAVFPIGARSKEHGPHLPMNNDYVMAEYLAERVAESCPVLVFPTVPYGYYPAFIEYPGSVTLSESTFESILFELGEGISKQGAECVYFLNTGVSTLPALKRARARLIKNGIPCEYCDPLAFPDSGVELEQAEGTHADEVETSIMLYMAPEIVQMDRAVCEIPEQRTKGPLRRNVGDPGLYSPSGIWGDATRATKEKGRLLTEVRVESIIQQVASLINSSVSQ